MASKPDKNGLRLFMAVAAGGQDLGHYLMTEMTQRFYVSGRNVTCDRFVASLALSRALLQDRATIVETLTKNKKFNPKESVEQKNRPAVSSFFGFHQDKMNLVSYASKPRKSVILLSSQHNGEMVSEKTRTSQR